MPVLHVDLQDGFANDRVVVEVNDTEIFNKAAISTRLQTGLAESFAVDVPAGGIVVRIALPSRSASESVALPSSSMIYLGVSVSPDKRITCRASSEPFGYL